MDSAQAGVFEIASGNPLGQVSRSIRMVTYPGETTLIDILDLNANDYIAIRNIGNVSVAMQHGTVQGRLPDYSSILIIKISEQA